MLHPCPVCGKDTIFTKCHGCRGAGRKKGSNRPTDGRPSPKIDLPAPVVVTPAIIPVTSPAGTDAPDYLPAVSVANRLGPEMKAALNAEIHQGLATFKPSRFEVHQDIGTGAYFAVPFRTPTADGCKPVLWMEYFEGRPNPRFFPSSGAARPMADRGKK